MAKMLTLDPALELPLSSDWHLIVSEAGRYAGGLTASIGLSNGSLQTVEQVVLPDPAQRQAFALLVSYRTGLSPATVEPFMLQIFDAVEEQLRDQAQEGEAGHASQATRLVELVHEAGIELFHTPDGDAYGSIPVDGHLETYPLKVRGFRRRLSRLFYRAEDKSPGSQAVQDALAVLEGQALFDGPELPVYVRLAEQAGSIYLDLCNDGWQAVEVTPTGWRVVDTCPVKFRRMPGMLPLPLPHPGGQLSDLKALLNLNTDSDWRLVAHWLIATFRPRGPYPILVVHGGHGSAKTTLVKVARFFIDPNTAPLRLPPRDVQNVAIAASNSWIVAYDNLSQLPDWLSDALCCVATGLGFATRTLFTDSEETLFQAMRPIVVNGIEEVATRGDFLDRAIIVHLPAMDPQTVKDEETFWGEVERQRPQILGSLLDVVSQGLKSLPTVTLTSMPRMADFAKWSSACAPACGWGAQDFLTAYTDVRQSTHMLTLEASLLWPPLQDLMQSLTHWSGTPTELLAALATRVDEDTRRQREWPKKPNVFTNQLRRLVPTLKEVGTIVTITHSTNRRIEIRK
jgi:hypothetical protein